MAQEQAKIPPAFKHEATRVRSLAPADSNVERAAPTAPAAAPGPAAAPVPATAEDNSSGWSLSDQGLAEVLPIGLGRNAFEQVLKSNFFGTYVFYSKLQQADRDEIYTVYRETGTIDAVRANVMQRSRLRHRLK